LTISDAMNHLVELSGMTLRPLSGRGGARATLDRE